MWREKCDLCCVTPPSPCRGSAEKPGQAGLGREGCTAPLYFYPRCSSTPHSTAPSYQTTLGMVLSPLQHHQHQFIQFCNARSIKKLFSEGRYLLVDIIYTIQCIVYMILNVILLFPLLYFTVYLTLNPCQSQMWLNLRCLVFPFYFLSFHRHSWYILYVSYTLVTVC